MKNLKVGIIGAGKIVESNHLPALLNIPGISVSWIYDKNNERAKLLSNMYAVNAIPTWQDKLNNVDICLIATPYGVRDPYIRACAALRKCVYIEKPFATTLHEHHQYAELFDPHHIAIGFQRRYYPFMTDIKYIIKNQLFGKLKTININQGYFQIKGGAGFISDAKLSGGGLIIESAIHTLDQILEFTDAESMDVKEVYSLSKEGIDYDTVFTTKINTRDNSLNVQAHISCLQNLDNGLRLEFEKAIIHFQPSPDCNLFVTTHADNKIFQFKSVSNYYEQAGSVNASFVLFWQDFISAINSHMPNRTNAFASLLITDWIEQLYHKINKPAA
ncbi:MAG: NADH-dependent dehydrogenase family protein [Chitinophagaceae bacterium]|nr:NADH-dependent dehydrogenase family protein [Chitinophagaceae bacterium]